MATLAEHLPQLLLAWSIQWVGVLSPGPGVALIMSVATSRGRGASITTVAGIACGTITLAIATVIGVAAIFAQVSELMLMVRIIGAAYLAFLAYKAFKTAITLPPMTLKSTEVSGNTRTALAGYLMQVTNPKAIFFWLAVAAAGGVGTAPWPIVVLFVAGAFFNSFVGHGAYALVLSSTPFRAGYMGARRWIEGALGTFFALFAFKLATDRG